MITTINKIKRLKKPILGIVLSVVFTLLGAGSVSAQSTVPKQGNLGYFSNDLFLWLFITAVVLLVVIIVLGESIKQLLQFRLKDKHKINSAILIFFVLSALGISDNAIAQNTSKEVVDVATTYSGLDSTAFWFMISVIGLEVGIILFLVNILRSILPEPQHIAVVAEEKETSFIEMFNASVAIEEEATIMFDHEYDGIRELDNDLPPWWKYGFYLTILVAIIYLINYHVLKTAPSQEQEYKNEMAAAERQKEEFKRNSANNVDENSVIMLTDADAIAKGKTIFMDNCAACHGKLGEGTVGPNFTDQYWLHGGKINDIFKTIKYGVPSKGMIAWENQFSPVQIQQVACYIKTLGGTNPPNPKAPQGDLYKETNDSTAVASPKDSLVTAVVDTLAKK